MSHDSSSTSSTVQMSDDQQLAQLADAYLADMLPAKLSDPASSIPLRFDDIMGRDTAYWWRLYIDPQNWLEAEELLNKEPPKPPGLLYDTQNSPGFQAAMLNAYQNILRSTSATAKFYQTKLGANGTPMTWKEYEQLWEAALPSPRKIKEGEVAGKYQPGQFSSNFGEAPPRGQFGCPENLAGDLATELIGDWYLMAEAKDPYWNKAYAHRSNSDKTHFESMAHGKQLQDGVDLVFHRYSGQLKNAHTRMDQLKAIGQAVRALHIMHTFGDGNGRTNVFLLLPAMLLRSGFGLSLGRGLFGRVFPPNTMFKLFNGGYSVATIAKVLFVLQDKGLTLPRDGPTSLINPMDSPRLPQAPDNASPAHPSQPPVIAHDPKGPSTHPSLPATGHADATGAQHTASHSSSAVPTSGTKATESGSNDPVAQRHAINNASGATHDSSKGSTQPSGHAENINPALGKPKAGATSSGAAHPSTKDRHLDGSLRRTASGTSPGVVATTPRTGIAKSAVNGSSIGDDGISTSAHQAYATGSKSRNDGDLPRGVQAPHNTQGSKTASSVAGAHDVVRAALTAPQIRVSNTGSGGIQDLETKAQPGFSSTTTPQTGETRAAIASASVRPMTSRPATISHQVAELVLY